MHFFGNSLEIFPKTRTTHRQWTFGASIIAYQYRRGERWSYRNSFRGNNFSNKVDVKLRDEEARRFYILKFKIMQNWGSLAMCRVSRRRWRSGYQEAEALKGSKIARERESFWRSKRALDEEILRGESKRARESEREQKSTRARERFNFDNRMSGPDNRNFTKIISSIKAISSIDHKMKFSLIADRSIDQWATIRSATRSWSRNPGLITQVQPSQRR